MTDREVFSLKNLDSCKLTKTELSPFYARYLEKARLSGHPLLSVGNDTLFSELRKKLKSHYDYEPPIGAINTYSDLIDYFEGIDATPHEVDDVMIAMLAAGYGSEIEVAEEETRLEVDENLISLCDIVTRIDHAILERIPMIYYWFVRKWLAKYGRTFRPRMFDMIHDCSYPDGDMLRMLPSLFSIYFHEESPIPNAQGLYGDVKTAVNSITAASDSFIEMNQRVASANDRFTDVLDTIVRYLEGITQFSTDKVVMIASTIFDLIGYVQIGAMPYISIISICTRLVTCFLPMGSVLISSIVNAYFLPTAQGGCETILSGLVATLGACVIGVCPTKVLLDKIINNMRLVNVLAPFSKNMATFILAVLERSPEIIKNFAREYFPEFGLQCDLKESYEEMLIEMEHILTLKPNEIATSEDKFDKFTTIKAQLHSMVRKYCDLLNGNHAGLQYFRSRLTLFDKLDETVTSLRDVSSLRVCPFSLTIAGSSQIGKSTLSSAIAMFMFPDYPPDSVKYPVPTDPKEHWSGYNPSIPVTSEDDADQDASYENALAFFSIVTNAPYVLPMASVDDVGVGKKGTAYKSLMHIRCTNVPYPNPVTKINSVDAYLRRRHLVLYAEVDENYIEDCDHINYDPNFRHLRFYRLHPTQPNAPRMLVGNAGDAFLLIERMYREHMDNETALMNRVLRGNVREAMIREYDELARAQGLVELLRNRTINYERLKNEFFSYANSLNVAPISKVLAVFGSIVAGILVFRRVVDTSLPVADFIPSGDARTIKYSRVHKKRIVAEGSVDQSATAILQEAVLPKQAYVVVTNNTDSRTQGMCGVFVAGRNLLCPYHLFLDSALNLVTDGSIISITVGDNVYTEYFVSRHLTRLFTESREKDVCIYECGPSVRSFRDIRHLFIDEKDIGNVANLSPGYLSKMTRGNQEGQVISISPIANQKYSVGSDGMFTIIRGWQYKAATSSGDCGSVVLTHNTRIVGKILGIHIAGYTNTFIGFAELVTKQMLSAFGPRTLPPPLPRIIDDKPFVALAEGHYTLFGTVPRNMAFVAPTRTELRHSAIHDLVWKAKQAPAELGLPAISKSLTKYFDKLIEPNPQYYEVLLDDCICQLKQIPRDANDLGVTSEFVAINGDVRKSHSERINMNASPGYPYKLFLKNRGKTDLFDFDGQNYSISDNVLRERVDMREAHAKLGQRIESIWVDIPKDERRPIGKATRSITVPPLDFTIICRKYFMEFCDAFVLSCLSSYSAVGIDPYSIDWTILYNKLVNVSDVGFAGDYSKYDGHICARMLSMVCTAINEWYSFEADHASRALVREVLFDEIIHTVQLYGNVLYMTHQGNPSGNPLTTIINTIVNHSFLMLAWLGVAPPELCSPVHYYENVSEALYGDDNLLAVTPRALKFFNMLSVSGELSTYGVPYGMAEKGAELEAYSQIRDLTFLKNGFRVDGLRIWSLMDEDTLNEMVNWVRESEDLNEATVINVNCALRMWYQYGKEVFESKRQMLFYALVEAKVGNFALLDFSYLDNCYRSGMQPLIYDIPKAQGDDEQHANGSQTAGESDQSNVKTNDMRSGAVTFIEQKPSIVIDQSVSPLLSDNIMFGSWDAARIFGKPMRVGTYAFTTSLARGAVLKNVFLPQTIFNIGGSWAPYVSAFTFMKYRPVFRIQLNGNKFTAGRLLANVVPFWNDQVAPWAYSTTVNIAGATGFPHAFLDASSNDVVELRAPWVCPVEWYNIAAYQNPTADLYTHTANSNFIYFNTHILTLRVLNALSPATGSSTTIYATIWLYLEDVQLCVPRIGQSTSQGAVMSSSFDASWSVVAKKTLPKNVTADAIESRGSISASFMDKPNITLNPTAIVRRFVGYMDHATNFEQINRLALHPGGQSDVRVTDFGTTDDEMSLSYLCSKYTYWYTFSVNSTYTSLYNLTYFPITPYIVPKPNSTGPQLVEMNNSTLFGTGTTPSSSQIPLVSYVSMPFNYWGGSMKYRFDFVTNSFVTMKIFCAILYGTLSPDTATNGIDPSTTLGYTFEVNADSKTFEIEVPYVADQPWKRVMRSQFKQAGSSNVNALWDDSIPWECCIGQVALYVLNPLTVPVNMPTSYDVNVFIAGGPDFRLNYVSRQNRAFVPVLQGLDPNPGTDIAKLGQALMKTDLDCMSEVYTSVRDILKRYCHIMTVNAPVPAAVVTGSVTQYVMTPIVLSISAMLQNGYYTFASVDAQNFSTFHWYATLYRFMRGSLRFKIFVDFGNVVSTEGVLSPVGATPTFSVDYFPDGQNIPGRAWQFGVQDEGDIVSTTPADPTKAYFMLGKTTHGGPRDIGGSACPYVEIEVPYVCANRIRPIPQSGADATINGDKTQNAYTNRYFCFADITNQYGNLVVNLPTLPNPYTCVVRCFMAIGDDCRLGCCLGTPIIQYKGLANYTGTPVVNSGSVPDFYN